MTGGGKLLPNKHSSSKQDIEIPICSKLKVLGNPQDDAECKIENYEEKALKFLFNNGTYSMPSSREKVNPLAVPRHSGNKGRKMCKYISKLLFTGII